jgi:TetR/AcrR family acrAB operon transcriptional repressor
MARKTKEEAAETREALLDAAEEVFYSKGVARTRLQDIAQAAGVTRGALYWHFRDKADLFRALLERVQMPLEDLLDAIPAQQRGTSPLENLHRASLVALQRMEQPRFRRVHSILISRCEVIEDIDPVAIRREMAAAACTKSLALFEQAEQGGELVSGLDAETANQLFHSILYGLLHRWHLDTEAFSLLDTGRRLLDQWFTLIKST